MQETAGGTTTDLYYSDAWQVLEERIGGQTQVQYVWSPVYVDALVLRDRDSNGDGTLDERLYVVQDANYNVTGLFDNSGNVVERYVYDPFGQVTILDADWNVLAGSAFAWQYLHQGGRFDATSGLYHFRYRDYSPTLGRWTSPDPLRYAAGDVNLYRTVFNAPTVYTDPSGQAIFIPVLIIGGLLVGGAAAYTGWQSYQATGNPFDGQIWGAGGEGVVYVGPRVIVNGVSDTVVSTVTLGGVDRLELWPVPPEHREAYEWGYAGSRPLWELEAALLTHRMPGGMGRYMSNWDLAQNGVLVGRGVFDLPQVTRHGGGPMRLDWSQGMLFHGVTLENATDVGCGSLGLFGLGVPGLARNAPTGIGTLSRGAELRARYGEVFAEYMYFRNQGFTPAQAWYLTQPYEGMGHHFPIPQRTARSLGLPDWLRDCPFNVLKPNGISRGRFYELHYMVDPHFHGAAFPRSIGGSWRGAQLGLVKYRPWIRWWHATPGPTKVAGGVVIVGGGAAGGYWLFGGSDEE